MTFNVTIGGSTTIEVYGGLTACDAYIEGAIGDGATAYRSLAASGDDRKRLLVAATRYVERLTWQGTATTPAVGGTTLVWPRTGVTDPNGTAVDPNTVPSALTNAVFELVMLGATDPDALSAPDSGSNVKKLDADGTSIEFFRPTSALDGTASVLPSVVSQLVGKWLASASATVAGASGTSTGYGACSQFDDCDRLTTGGL
jgi:hypothetical protein